MANPSRTLVFACLAILILGCHACVAHAGIQPIGLTCEYAVNPATVERRAPRLSWILDSDTPGEHQSAWRILVATSTERLREGRADLWDSGVIRSSQSTHVTYRGAPLASRQRCYWRVRVWDRRGRSSGWSHPASWQMGLLEPADWTAHWIGRGPPREPRPSAGFFTRRTELESINGTVYLDGRSTLLRREFNCPQRVRQATAYVCGLGYYEFYCNGRRVGPQVLAPAKTNYRQWVLYDAHDLTPLVRRGTNALGIMLGNGWFNPYPKWWDPYRMQWFGSPRALVQIHLEYADGTNETLGSDDAWRTAPGPVQFACIYDGEVYDATQEQPGWDLPGFDDRGWTAAQLVESPGGRLVGHLMPPIRVTQHLRPVRLTQPSPGTYVFDLGQNFAGWARLRASGPRGTRITLRYAEDLYPDGTLDPRSNERAAATDIYIMKGIGRELYEPRFTFHGFQYVEVTGYPGVPTLDDLTGCVVHTACEATGEFACSNESINAIHRATRWSLRSNLMGYPMDCPQRDERLGWFGDAMVTAETAMLNLDVALFFRHWLDGIRANQNPANGDISIISPRPYVPDEPDPTWSSAYLVVAWQYYVHYGDRDFLAAHFDAMRRYVDFLGTQATNHILPKYWIGDWGTTVAGWQEGEPVSVGTAFYYYNTVILEKAARVLGRLGEAEGYGQLAARIRTAYNQAFFDADRQRYDQGSQFSQALPLFLGMVEPGHAAAVQRQILDDLQLHQGHFTVGVLGAKYLMDALTQSGRPDAAYGLATQTGYPSWAHLIEGRTTLSEFWDLHGSHNHAMMGSVDAWFYRTLAGIQPDESAPGFEHIRVQPYIPPSLRWVRARVQTVRGPIRVAWENQAGRVRLDLAIPPNTRASVRLPARHSSTVRTAPLRLPCEASERAIHYQVPSGKHRFEFELAPERP